MNIYARFALVLALALFACGCFSPAIAQAHITDHGKTVVFGNV